MIDPEIEAQIERLLADGVPQREIAGRLGVARSTVERIASGRRPADLARRPRKPTGDPESALVRRCATCGARVELPCRACRTRDLLAIGRIGLSLLADPADDEALTIDLRDEAPERYLAIRHRKEQQWFGRMLRRAEETDDREPTDWELTELEREEQE